MNDLSPQTPANLASALRRRLVAGSSWRRSNGSEIAGKFERYGDFPTRQKDQVLYVWFDALGNYISALGYGSDDDTLFSRYWTRAAHRIHVIGKGFVRFHAVYWPAMLLSAEVPLPTEVRIHDYLTVDGIKIAKSRGNAIGPGEAVARHGVDAVRYCLLRHVRTTEDGDFSYARLSNVYRTELADGLGNLLSRTLGLIRPGMELPGRVRDPELGELVDHLPGAIEAAVEDFQLHQGLRTIWLLVDAANAFVSRREPWKLARAGDDARLREVIDDLLTVLEIIAEAPGAFSAGDGTTDPGRYESRTSGRTVGRGFVPQGLMAPSRKRKASGADACAVASQ